MPIRPFARPLRLVLPLLLACSSASFAQDSGTFTLSVNAQVVTVPVVVHDSKGHLIDNLSKDDFTLTEDGHPQTIRYMTVDKDRPLTLGLLIDTSGSQKDYIAKERAAAKAFIETMLTRPDDTAFLVRFDNAITLLQAPTSDKAKLEEALGHLEDPHPGRLDPPGGTLMFDALDTTCERITRDVSGRNAVVLLTDGHDNGSVKTMDDTIEQAQLSNTVIYSVFYSDSADSFTVTHGGPKPLTGKEVLAKLSDETGGHEYQVSIRRSLDSIFTDIADEMRTQYVLAYTPTQRPGSGFRNITLKAKDKGWKIQTRAGYYYYPMDSDD